jgi:phage repressor protein C with HTH and peptisase S24 domain
MRHQPLVCRNSAGAARGNAIEQLPVVDDDRRQPRKASFVLRRPYLGSANKSFDQHHAGNMRAIALSCQRAIARDTFRGGMRDNARMKIDATQVAARATELAHQKKLTDREASIDATGKPDMIRDMRRGRMPSSDRLQALADTLSTTVDFLLGKSPSSVRPGEDPPAGLDRLPRDVPVYGTALGANLQLEDGDTVVSVEQTIIELTDVIDRVIRHPGIAGDMEAYSLTVVGDSMSPRWDDGDPIYITTKRQAAIGDYVVIQVRDGSEEVVSALVKRLVGRRSDAYQLEQFQPAIRFWIPVTMVARMHPVLTPRQLAGQP